MVTTVSPEARNSLGFDVNPELDTAYRNAYGRSYSDVVDAYNANVGKGLDVENAFRMAIGIDERQWSLQKNLAHLTNVLGKRETDETIQSHGAPRIKEPDAIEPVKKKGISPSTSSAADGQIPSETMTGTPDSADVNLKLLLADYTDKMYETDREFVSNAMLSRMSINEWYDLRTKTQSTLSSFGVEIKYGLFGVPVNASLLERMIETRVKAELLRMRGYNKPGQDVQHKLVSVLGTITDKKRDILYRKTKIRLRLDSEVGYAAGSLLSSFDGIDKAGQEFLLGSTAEATQSTRRHIQAVVDTYRSDDTETVRRMTDSGDGFNRAAATDRYMFAARALFYFPEMSTPDAMKYADAEVAQAIRNSKYIDRDAPSDAPQRRRVQLAPPPRFWRNA